MMRSFPQRLLPKKLRTQVVLIVSFLLAATVGLYAWHISLRQADIVTDATSEQASLIAKSIANLSIPYMLTEDYASIETLLVRMAELSPVLSLCVCDEKGNVYSSVSRPAHGRPVVSYSRARLDPPGDLRPYLTMFAGDRIIAWHPIDEGSLLGWVRVEYSLQVLHELQFDTWRKAFFSGIAAVSAGVFLILLFLNRHISAVDAVTGFAKRLGDVKGGTIDVSDGSVETEQLVAALNQTSRRLAEQDRSLKESERKYRTLFEESKDVIFFATVDGRVLDVNQAGVELFGYGSKEELLKVDVGRDLYADPGDRDEFSRIIRSQGFIKDYELRLRRKAGEMLIVLITATAVADPYGRIVMYRGILRDVTAERGLEAQLRHAQKMEAVGQLTGGIAHDFNNILSAIIGFAYILQSKLRDGDPLKTNAELILSAAERAAALTQNLLIFSSRQISNPKPVAVNEIVNRLGKLLSQLMGDDIDLVTRLSPDNPGILADNGQMDQVLMNLAANARDAMPSGGTFTISTGRQEIDASFIARHGFGEPGSHAVISASDTGAGMDVETVKRIFEPFFTTKEVGKGTGLGLSIVYGIVKQHKGHIAVSSAPGQGTCFTIYLPVVQPDAIPEPVPEERAVPGGTETILVAEDDNTLRTLTRILLTEAGYRMIEAVDGRDAIEKFSEHRENVDLLLLDVTMPGKNGREVYDEIKALRPDVKVLFISAHTTEDLQKRGLLDPGCNFISKPVAPPLLLGRIREVLDAG